jgi:hypothetical protein
MPIWLQHTLVIALVAACVIYIVYQAVRSVQMRGGRIGSCCAKGCAEEKKGDEGARVAFIPADALRKRK